MRRCEFGVLIGEFVAKNDTRSIVVTTKMTTVRIKIAIFLGRMCVRVLCEEEKGRRYTDSWRVRRYGSVKCD